MSLLALLAAASDATSVPVVATGPMWNDDAINGGGTWSTPTEDHVTYSPASGTATAEQTVTVTATAAPGYYIDGPSSWSHTFPAASPTGPDGEPYTMPTSSPWNPPTYIPTPTPDGTGSATHPSVLDFGPAGWNGWRYWMAMTPFYNADETLENPCILVSNQAGAGWQVPAGLTNPVYGWPGTSWNSDTDLEYDPVADELILLYRHTTSQLRVARSSDGVTWPAVADTISTDPIMTGGAPSLTRVGPTDWHLWTVYNAVLYHMTTTDPTLLTGWTTPQACTLPVVGRPWHHDVTLDGAVFRMTIDCVSSTGSSSGSEAGITVASSTDGVAWTVPNSGYPLILRGNSVPNPSKPAGYDGWDLYQTYRPTMTLHENGTHYRVWYGARGAFSWRVGYVRLPRSLWPAPPT